MDISVDIRTLANNLSKFEKRLPYALSDTINNVAFDAQRGIKAGVPHWLKLTKQFIPKQVFVNKAKPRALVAAVGFGARLHLVDKMLKTSHGGVRVPFKGSHIAVPVGVRRNARGGVTKANRPEALLTKPNVFRATIHGRDGIWRRNSKAMARKTGYNIALLYVLVPNTKYTGGNIKLVETVTKAVDRRFAKYMEKNLRRELDFAIKRSRR